MDPEAAELGGGSAVPPARGQLLHYQGDTTRLLFVIAAVVLVLAKSTGVALPLSSTGTVLSAVILVIAAGITSPAYGMVHWANAAIAALGTLVFGVTAVRRYNSGSELFDHSFLFIEALALISLIALYLTTRTIRGFQSRAKPL